MTIESFDDLRQAIKPYITQSSSATYTLDRMRKLLAYLGNPQESYKAVHIAGTSGKTSTAYYAAALLKAAGYRTGLTVSPHTLEVNDRVQIDCQPLLEPLFCAEFELFMDEVQASGTWPTYFEIMVAFAYWEFARQDVEYAVVEVGLGGLLDGTNTISRADKVCIITDIGLDHTNILGKTYGEIAIQKAGIIQESNEVFVYRQSAEVMKPIQDRASAKHAKVTVVEPGSVTAPQSLPLFQQRNFGLALTTVRHIVAQRKGTLSDAAIRRASRTFIPGRMEIFTFANKTIILDGAHNGQKVKALMESIHEQNQGKSIVLLLGFLDGPAADTRIPDILEAAAPAAEHVIVTEFGGPQDEPYRSVLAQEVERVIKPLEADYAIDHQSSARTAFEHALKRPEAIIVVAGSIYLLNHIRPLVLAKADHKK